MFAQTWRSHWGLKQDPFAFEDADKDPILAKVDSDAVHSSFDRIFGNFETPAPGIVFGEKGSGKSGLRLAMTARIKEHNAAVQSSEDSPTGGKVFLVEYTSFDLFIDNFRLAHRLPAGKEKTAIEVSKHFRLSDHIDSILSIATTKFVDKILDREVQPRRLMDKQKFNLLSLTALYYNSKQRTTAEALEQTRSKLHFSGARQGMVLTGRILMTLLGIAAAFVPHIGSLDLELPTQWNTFSNSLWHGIGGAVVGLTWLTAFFQAQILRMQVSRALKSVNVVRGDSKPLARLLGSLRPALRREVALPSDVDDASRYDLLQCLMDCLNSVDYTSMYVLMDRVDESTLLAGKEDLTRRFVEKIVNHRLLQFPGIAMKLFLPVELGGMYLGATPDELKRMRLDKSNTVQELRWTGQELYEIAGKRLSAVCEDISKPFELNTFFAEEVNAEALRDTLAELGTPRYAFGFLSALFSEYIRNLPNELGADSSNWKVSRAHFDLIRSAWTNRARVLRQALN